MTVDEQGIGASFRIAYFHMFECSLFKTRRHRCCGWSAPGPGRTILLRFSAIFGGIGRVTRRIRDAMENRTKPSPSPRPLPQGEGEHANASSRLGECRLRSHAPKLDATAARPSSTRPNALAHSALPDEPSGSPSPLGRGRGEGEGISLSFTAFFSAVGSGLNSIENSEEPFPKGVSGNQPGFFVG